ncbi:MAG TPA: HEAT repeat domain-containing protein, partial [Anaerolineae bacterium]
MVLLALVEYRSTGLLLEATTTSQQLANYLALLTGIGNIFVLPMLLFVISRLIARLGLGNAALIYPVGNLAICGGLVLAPGLASASFAYLDRTALRIALQSSVTNLFYNAVSLHVRGRARAFVSGLVVPLGSLIGGTVLLVPLFLSIGWFVPAAIGLLAVAYLLSSLVIRQKYGQALVKMLQEEDFSFLLSHEASDLTVADPATLALLLKKLEASTNRELTVFIAQLIARGGSNQGVPILAQAVRDAADARTRAALIDVVVASDLQSKSVANLYLSFLNDPDAAVRQSVMAGLDELVSSSRPNLLLRLMPMLQDPDTGVRVRVLSMVCRSGSFYQLPPAIQLMDQLLGDRNPHWRAAGVHLLGDVDLRAPAGDDRALRLLLNHLADPEDEVRLEAAVAIEAATQSIKQDKQPETTSSNSLNQSIVEKMGLLLKDPVERVRQAALAVIA